MDAVTREPPGPSLSPVPEPLTLAVATIALFTMAGCRPKSSEPSTEETKRPDEVTRDIEVAEPVTQTPASDPEPTLTAEDRERLGYVGAVETPEPRICTGCGRHELCDPCIVGWYGTEGSSPFLDIVVAGELVYVAAGRSGVLVFDVSASTPRKIAAGETGGFTRKLSLDGDVLHAASMQAGLETFSVDGSGSISRLGGVATPGQARDVHARDGLAVVADAAEGLQVIDVSDPAHPAIVSSLDTPGTASGIVLDDGYAFLADGWNELECEKPNEHGCDLRVFDVTDPAAPSLAGIVDVSGVNELALDGDTLYAAGWELLFEYDVKNPQTPLRKRVITTDCPQDVPVKEILATKDSALDERGFELYGGITITPEHVILDGLVLDRETLEARRWIVTPAETPHAGAMKDGRYLVADGEGGLAVVELGDPELPALSHVTALPAECVAMDGNESTLLVVTADMDERGRLLAYDISKGGAPRPTWESKIRVDGWSSAIHVHGDQAWVVDRDWDHPQILVLDISDPRERRQLGRIPLQRSASAISMAVEETTAFLVLRDFVDDRFVHGLETWDVSDLQQPEKLASIDLQWKVHDTLAVAGTLFAAEGRRTDGVTEGIVEIVDVSDPASPAIVGSVSVDAIASSLELTGTNLVISLDDSPSSHEGGTVILDVADRAHPVPVGPGKLLTEIYLNDSHNSDTMLAGDILYAIHPMEGGLSIFDLSDPSRPSFLASAVWPHPTCCAIGEYQFLHVAGDHAYICGSEDIDRYEIYTIVLREGHADGSTSPR